LKREKKFIFGSRISMKALKEWEIMTKSICCTTNGSEYRMMAQKMAIYAGMTFKVTLLLLQHEMRNFKLIHNIAKKSE
jgi:hypothetical protein